MATYTLTTNDCAFVNNADVIILPILSTVTNGKLISVQVESGTATIHTQGEDLLNYSNSSLSLIAGNYFFVAQVGNSWHMLSGATSGAGSVSQIVAGTNVTITPSGGTGAVTVNASGGGGASVLLSQTVTFTNAQVLAASVTPQAFGVAVSGKCVLPTACILQNVIGNDTYTGSTVIFIKDANNVTLAADSSSAFINVAGALDALSIEGQQNSQATPGDDVFLFFNSALTGGTGGIKATLFYVLY